MSLKDLISTLIESAFTSKKEFIVQQTYLDYSKNVVIRNDTINTAENISYVAPGDGVIVSYLNDKTSINGIMTTLGSMSLVNFGAVTGVASTATFAPVKKGEGVTIFTKTFDYANRVVRYIPYLGGGLSSILQALGGGLWLRLNHSFKRCSGYQAGKHCHQTAKLITSSRIFLTGYGFKCRLMGILLLDVTIREMSRYVMTLQEFTHHQVTQAADILRASSWLKKEILSPLKSAEVTRQTLYFGRFQQSARLNLACEGGAL